MVGGGKLTLNNGGWWEVAPKQLWVVGRLTLNNGGWWEVDTKQWWVVGG